LSDEPDTWFLVMEVVPERGGGWWVARADRETLPKATVVSGPHETEAEAERLADQMRQTRLQ
jgi:hypothetical protein